MVYANLFNNFQEKNLEMIFKNNGFKYRKTKSGSFYVTITENYFNKYKRDDIYYTRENNKIFVVGMTIKDGKKIFTFRVITPGNWKYAHLLNKTRIGLKHWTDNDYEAFSYINNYLKSKVCEKDY